MVAKKTNQRIGKESERSFRSLIRNHSDIVDKIKLEFNIDESLEDVYFVGENQSKADVLLNFEKSSIGVNIKAGSSNFNQVMRVWLKDFNNVIKFSEETVKAIQDGIDNYRLKRCNKFILPSHQEMVAQDIKSKLSLILQYIFMGVNGSHVRILALHDLNNKKLHIYNMKKVLDYLNKSDIAFSKKGIVKIGEYLTMQRKGGNGVSVKVAKGDKKHPGNQLQFKMCINSFMTNYQDKILSTDMK